MALIVDQQMKFKHFCKICKKGFLCGRALGGHMRAHGAGDEGAPMEDEDDDDDDEGIDWDVPPCKKRMYALRTNPNRFKSCRVCENCGQEFSSWKSFLEHGKCSSEEEDDESSSPARSDDDDDIGINYSGWCKRKRSFRAQVGHHNSNSEEENFAANCLVMLSNAATLHRNPNTGEEYYSCASACKEHEERRNPLINFISSNAKSVSKSGLFECKACKKVFNSHQALGGHRASHKKVKGCFAARFDQIEEDDDVITPKEVLFPNLSQALTSPSMASSSPLKRTSKLHECSICHRVFSSGQALGGHKRCHWITSNASQTSTLPRFQQFHQIQLDHLKMDLNLPAHWDHELEDGIYLQSWVERKEAAEDELYHKKDKTKNKNKNDIDDQLQNVEDEADSTMKLVKLIDLKDMNLGGNSTAWLQVGIGSGGGTTTKNFGKST